MHDRAPALGPVFTRALSPAVASKLLTALAALQAALNDGSVTASKANIARHVVNNAVAEAYDATVLTQYDFRTLPPLALRLAQRTRFPTVAALPRMLRDVEATGCVHPFADTLLEVLRDAEAPCALVRAAMRKAAKLAKDREGPYCAFEPTT